MRRGSCENMRGLSCVSQRRRCCDQSDVPRLRVRIPASIGSARTSGVADVISSTLVPMDPSACGTRRTCRRVDSDGPCTRGRGCQSLVG
jgi:hypothetical protein